jgi:hypothetical protein
MSKWHPGAAVRTRLRSLGRKHPHHSLPGNGYLTIGQYSSLRKLMRAARRGRIPDERLVLIETVEKKAALLKLRLSEQ